MIDHSETRFVGSRQWWGAILVLIILTPLLLHAGVPYLVRTIGGTLRIPHFGYIAHLSAYFVATSAILWLVQPQTRRGWGNIVMLVAVHGICSEVLQLWIPARDFDVLDMTCNLLSIQLAAVSWLWWKSSTCRHQRTLIQSG